MLRRFLLALPCALVVMSACSDDQLPTTVDTPAGPRFAISDGARGGTPEFFWLTPTVATAPAPTGQVDATALSELTVEICLLASGGGCQGAPLQQLDATSLPMPSRLAFDQASGAYQLTWLSGPSRVAAGRNYRVAVKRSGVVLGFVDVAMVQSTPQLAGVNTELFTGLVKGQQFPVRFRLERPSAARYVKVNEVESNGGTPGDWVELYNTSDRAIDIGGYVFRDNDDTRQYVLPAGASIPGKGYYVIDEAVGVPGFDFGLGTADNARFYAPDGTTLIDNFAWSGGHAPTTFGRCPDGTGAFLITAGSTKGRANTCALASATVKINEVESNGGTPGDWVELINTGLNPADVGGFIFRDNNNASTYVIPANTVIAPGGYLVLNEIVNSVGDFSFGLGAGDAARLFATDGTTLVDSYSWTAHAAVTYARCPNGIGSFLATTTATKGVINSCPNPAAAMVVNEVESNGGTPGDWIEFLNTGASAIDLSGYYVKDNDNTRTYQLPAGTIVQPGAYLVVEEAQFGFGLGGADEARLIAPDNTTVIASYSWAAHATTTYGRCPNGTGALVTTTSSTKGSTNDCSSPVRINEVESDGGTPGDWVELINSGASPVDVSGYVLRDNSDASTYTIPAGTSIAAGGYLVLEVAQFLFGLGGADAARLFAPDGATPIDSYTWAAHAPATTYGRCPNGTGGFSVTTVATKGSANSCPGDLVLAPWPGDATVAVADAGAVFGTNMSGLSHVGSGSAVPGVLWASKNGPGTVYRLLWSGSLWAPDAENSWSAGKLLRYPDGLGDVDAEGIVAVGSALYVAAERNNAASSISRNSILRYDQGSVGTSLTALNEWNLTTDLPVVGANLGLEAITFIPDSYLTANGFRDEATGLPYAPGNYPNHGGGLFFVALEANGTIYAYALNHVTSGFTRVATIVSGYTGVMDLTFDDELQQLWAVCDDTCGGRSAILRVDTAPASPTLGRFIVGTRYERPSGMPNINNEGFAVGRQAECVGGRKPAYWADDNGTGGFAIRRGTVSCTNP